MKKQITLFLILILTIVPALLAGTGLIAYTAIAVSASILFVLVIVLGLIALVFLFAPFIACFLLLMKILDL